MSFQATLDRYAAFDFDRFLDGCTAGDVRASLSRKSLAPRDLLTLLSPAAEDFLEAMARRARETTIRHFGRTVQLYIPLYIANHCINECLYCGFNRCHAVARSKLSLAEIDREAAAIAATGMRHILVLTGEAPAVTPMEFLEAAVRRLKVHFPSVSIEIFPMDRDDYARLRKAGVDGLTLYQEVYDRQVYRRMHRAGPKTDYGYRLDGPQRGAEAGFRAVNIGALLGLADPRRESFFTGLHARYLEERFPECEIGVSLPRINPAEGGFAPPFAVDDRLFVRILTALRLFLPRASLPISTRERADFRDRLIHIGATRLSAGSRTGVGGYADAGPAPGASQFEICDSRPVDEVVAAIQRNGYQPVFKDWDTI